ncbi:hypothetical protein BGX26_008984, partial [Mortierella sp. AD094]
NHVTTLNLFCVVNGDRVSSAFKVKPDTKSDVSDLKNIMSEIETEPYPYKPKDLVLWHVTIPAGEEKVITADNISPKAPLMGGVSLERAFKDGIPEDTIHIIVEQPK